MVECQVMNKNSNMMPFKWWCSNLFWMIFQRIVPAKVFLSIRYRIVFGRWMDWNNPKTFNEKLQWLKINYYGKQEADLVDKIKVKRYISSIIGEQYVLPTIGEWKSPDEIPFDKLPDEYVLKCNHDSGSVYFSKNAAPLDPDEIRRKLHRKLKTNYYWSGRETPYKYVVPKVFAEPLIKCSEEKQLYDYKFFCFNGVPKVFRIDYDRFIEHHANYYDIEGHQISLGLKAFPPSDVILPMPNNLSEMVDVAGRLAKGLPFSRIDLYNIEGVIICGEITLFPGAGFSVFNDDVWDMCLGDWIDLPQKRKNK